MGKSLLLVATLVACGLSFQSCSDDDDNLTPAVQGCMDQNSLNYNPAATVDNGNCLYVADNYVGNYLAKDTIESSNPNTGEQMVEYRTYSFSISKVSNSAVKVSNFNNNCLMDANVTTTVLSFTDPNGQCSIGNFVGLFDGNKLEYAYYTDGPANPFVQGVAIKQN